MKISKMLISGIIACLLTFSAPVEHAAAMSGWEDCRIPTPAEMAAIRAALGAAAVEGALVCGFCLGGITVLVLGAGAVCIAYGPTPKACFSPMNPYSNGGNPRPCGGL